MTHIRDQVHTARKRHECQWCDAAILPGDQYIRASYAEDGIVWTQKEHPICQTEVMHQLNYGEEPGNFQLTDDVEGNSPQWRKWYAEQKAKERTWLAAIRLLRSGKEVAE